MNTPPKKDKTHPLATQAHKQQTTTTTTTTTTMSLSSGPEMSPASDARAEGSAFHSNDSVHSNGSNVSNNVDGDKTTSATKVVKDEYNPDLLNRWWLILERPVTKTRSRALMREVLSGLTVALAQVPEAVSFAFIAGVDPLVGLQAAWIVGLITALLGGAPGVVSGATGALAVVMTEFVDENGPEYLFVAVLMMGVIEVFLGLIHAGELIRLVGTPVMMGFVNGLAIVIFMAQLPLFQEPENGWDSSACKSFLTNDTSNAAAENNRRRLSGGGGAGNEWLDGTTVGWQVLVVILTMAVIVVLPKFVKSFPASLAGILVGMVVEFGIIRPSGYCTPTVGDLATISGAFPIPIWADDQYDIPSLADSETWSICLPLAITLAIIGLVESLMTAQLVAELTDRPVSNRMECIGQGAANVVAGIFGTMGGCAMIGQSMINVKSGGVTRISTASAALFLLIVILAASAAIDLIPVAALAGVMFMVVFHTFEWETLAILVATLLPQKYRTHPKLRMLKKVKRSDLFIIVIVTAVAVWQNLAYAVGLGVALSALVFSWDQGSALELKHIQFEPLDGDAPSPNDTDPEEVGIAVMGTDTDVDAVKAATAAAAATAATVAQVAASKVKRSSDKAARPPEGTKVYELHGPLFFGSAQSFQRMFDFVNDPQHVELHFANAQASDFSALAAINGVARKYHSLGKKFRLRYVQPSSMRAFVKAGQLLYINDAKLGHEFLANELLALSEVPHWTIPDGYVEEEEETTDGKGSSVTDGKKSKAGADDGAGTAAAVFEEDSAVGLTAGTDDNLNMA